MQKNSVGFKVVAEILSAVAVVISLVFVGFQMEENTRATRSAIVSETTSTISEWYNSLADNAESAQTFRAFIRDPSLLNADDQYTGPMKFHSLM